MKEPRELSPEEVYAAAYSVLLLAAVENGVTEDQIDRALGSNKSENEKRQVVERLERLQVPVAKRSLKLPDLPLSSIWTDVKESLAGHGIKTWRDLFQTTEPQLREMFPDGAVFNIADAVRRTGFRLGMTPEEIDRRSEELSDLFATGLSRPEFSTRALNSLYNIGATTFGSLCAHEEQDLFKIPMFGRSTFEGVVDALKKRGLFLGMIVPGFGGRK